MLWLNSLEKSKLSAFTHSGLRALLLLLLWFIHQILYFFFFFLEQPNLQTTALHELARSWSTRCHSSNIRNATRDANISGPRWHPNLHPLQARHTVHNCAAINKLFPNPYWKLFKDLFMQITFLFLNIFVASLIENQAIASKTAKWEKKRKI